MSDNNQIPQNPMEHEVPILDNPGNEVPPQPVQFTQPDFEQASFSQAPYNQQQYIQPQSEQPNVPKKGKKKVAGLIAAIVGIIACGCVAVFAGPKIIAALSNSAKGAPIDRFKNAITEHSKDVTENLSKENPWSNFNSENLKADIAFDVTLGEYLTAMLPEEYSSIKNIGGSMNVVSLDKKQYVNLALSAQNTHLASMEVYLDQLANMAYIKVPELSAAYLSASLDSDTFSLYSNTTLNKEAIDPSKIATLINDETEIFLSAVKTVTLEDDVEVDANDVTAKYDKLTTTLQGKQVSILAYDVVKRFIEDQTIASLINDSLVNKYGESTDSILEVIKSTELADENKIIIDMYLDSEDEIVGMVLTLSGSENKMEIGFLSAKDKKTGFDIFAEIDDQKVLKIEGSYTEKSDAYTGNATLSVYEDGFAIASVDLSFEDVTSTDDKFSGKFSVSSAQLMGATINFDINSTKENVTFKLDVLMAASSLLSATFNTSISEASSIPTVPADAVIYDSETQSEDYMYGADIMGLLQNIQEVTGIDLTSMLYGY